MQVDQRAVIYGDADPQQAQATKISSNIEITVIIHTCGGKPFGFHNWNQYPIALLDQ